MSPCHRGLPSLTSREARGQEPRGPCPAKPRLEEEEEGGGAEWEGQGAAGVCRDLHLSRRHRATGLIHSEPPAAAGCGGRREPAGAGGRLYTSGPCTLAAHRGGGRGARLGSRCPSLLRKGRQGAGTQEPPGRCIPSDGWGHLEDRLRAESSGQFCSGSDSPGAAQLPTSLNTLSSCPE